MSIRFACPCGKRLSAPDALEGRHTQCPACYSWVPIPARRSASPGTPLLSRDRTTQHRAKRASVSTFVPALSGPSLRYAAEAPEIRLRRPPKWVKLLPKRVEGRWYHSVTYPVPNVPVFFQLAALLTMLTAVGLWAWLSIDRERPAEWPIPLFSACVALSLLVLGSTFSYFNAVLSLAAQGKAEQAAGMEFAADRSLISCGQWLATFFAGPAFLFAAAFGYWLYSGDLTPVDWLILAELGFAGVGWWLISLLLTNVDEGIRVPSPQRIVRTALRLRWRAAELTLLASAVFLGHFFAAVYGVAALHAQPLSALPVLWLCWTSGLYLTAFTFRRLGLTYYRLERRRPATLAVSMRKAKVLFIPVPYEADCPQIPFA